MACVKVRCFILLKVVPSTFLLTCFGLCQGQLIYAYFAHLLWPSEDDFVASRPEVAGEDGENLAESDGLGGLKGSGISLNHLKKVIIK